MKNNKDYSDLFDDDFEVTYEEEDNIFDTSPKNISGYKDTEEFVYDDDDYTDDGYEDEDDSYDDEDTDQESQSRHKKNRRSNRDSRYPDNQRDSGVSNSRRRKRRRGVPLAAPIRKGGRTLSRIAAALIRSLTAVLIIALTAYVLYTFWRASAPYGDIPEFVHTGKTTATLAAYLCFPALFLLFELISLIWSMTRVRVRGEMGSWKEDTGRGLFSFIFVFAVSYLSFLFAPVIPETPEAVYGIKGALEVYGSMHNVLFGLCIAGVISCIVRKYLR